jgi:hypothetical protein
MSSKSIKSMNRRQFMKNSAVLSAASLLPLKDFKGIKKIGIQLFSLPRLLEKDFKSAILMLSKMGYKEIELYGPFTFSTYNS